MRRVYRLLLSLYPVGFREEFGKPMQRQFGDEYGEAEGSGERLRTLLQALGDIAVSLPAELGRELIQDLRYASRMYKQQSLVTVLSLAALALAIGATTGVFSVLNALLIRSLPFREPQSLVELWLGPTNVAHGRAAFQAWRDHSQYLSDMAGYAVNEMNLNGAHDSARVKVSETTANFLQLLGTEPAFGRGFAPEEDIPGRSSVAVIGYGLWQNFFGADPRVLGSSIRLNGIPLTVIGVAPQGFDYPENTAIWTPTVYDLERIPKSGAFGWQTIGRLKPGITTAQASAFFNGEVRQAARSGNRPEIEGNLNRPQLISLRDRLAGPVRSASSVLMGMVAFVLLIACANLAHLLLSRTTERQRELSVRMALGASRARLIQQLVTEATALTVSASLVGLAVAHWTAQLAANAQPSPLFARQYTVLDWRVIGFALSVAVISGIVFGVLPASMVRRLQPSPESLRAQIGSGGSNTGRMRGFLSLMQGALTVTLVAGAFSMGSGFLHLMRTDLGFQTKHIATLNVSLGGTRYETESRSAEFFEQSLERLRSVPGVEAASAVSYLPLIQGMFSAGRFHLDSGEQGPVALVIAASPDYFRSMGTQLIEGRDFTDRDRLGAEPVIVISDDLERSFGRGHLVGRKLDLAFQGKPRMATIVGVVRSQRFAGPESEGTAQIFRPIEQSPSGFATFVAKVHGDAEQYLPVLRDAVQGVSRDVPVYDMKTLDQRLAETLARPRFYTTAILFFAAFAVLLAGVGTYGVATYAVAQRTHEIGVRIAVGASSQRVRGMIMRQTLLPVLMGILAGAFGAAGLGRFLESLIIGASQLGLWTCFGAAVVLASVAAIAVWTATDRIGRMDPSAALRAE